MRFIRRLSIFLMAALFWPSDIRANKISLMDLKVYQFKAGDGTEQVSSLKQMRLHLRIAYVSNNRIPKTISKQPIISTVRAQTRMTRTAPNQRRPKSSSLEHLFQRWAGFPIIPGWPNVSVYRPKGWGGANARNGYQPDPSNSFVFHKNGRFEHMESFLRFGSRPHISFGTWEFDPNDSGIIHWRLPGFSSTRDRGSFRIIELKKDLLRITSVRTNILDLYQSWTHSREELKGTSFQIFRPTGSRKFPPSRFRMKYVFHKNGAFEFLYLAPNDGHYMKKGNWSMERGNVLINWKSAEGGGGSFRILNLSKDRLLIAPVRSDPSNEIAWLVDFAKAKAKSAKEGKPILMEFTGSDWCPPCKALNKNVLTSDVFKQQIPKKFILLKLDNTRDKSKQTPEEIPQYKKLSAAYKIRGVPTIMVADATGREKHRQVGYNSRQTAQQWVTKIMSALIP